MRVLLTTPLPRWFILVSRLLASVAVSILQVYAFLAIAFIFTTFEWLEIDVDPIGYITVLPALILSGFMLGALGMALSSTVKQLENFAGVMNFVIFPMFFISSALYPLWKLQDAGAEILYLLAQVNPFTHVVELIRFAFYGQFSLKSFCVVLIGLVVFFSLAVWGYDPQRGMSKKGRKGA